MIFADYAKAFLVGGSICLIGQLLIDFTKLTPARILVSFVVIGVFLGGIGVCVGGCFMGCCGGGGLLGGIACGGVVLIARGVAGGKASYQQAKGQQGAEIFSHGSHGQSPFIFLHYTGKRVIRQAVWGISRDCFFLETFFEKGIAFFFGLWYNIMRLGKTMLLNDSYSERYRSGHNRLLATRMTSKSV